MERSEISLSIKMSELENPQMPLDRKVPCTPNSYHIGRQIQLQPQQTDTSNPRECHLANCGRDQASSQAIHTCPRLTTSRLR